MEKALLLRYLISGDEIGSAIRTKNIDDNSMRDQQMLLGVFDAIKNDDKKGLEIIEKLEHQNGKDFLIIQVLIKDEDKMLKRGILENSKNIVLKNIMDKYDSGFN